VENRDGGRETCFFHKLEVLPSGQLFSEEWIERRGRGVLESERVEKNRRVRREGGP